MTENAMAAQRPAAITGICVVGLLGLVALVALSAMGGLDNTPGWYPPFLVVSTVIGLTAMVGLFLMRKWGFFLYCGLFALNQVVMLATGYWAVQSAIVPLIVIIIASRHLAKMR
jgi:hypothetical protein